MKQFSDEEIARFMRAYRPVFVPVTQNRDDFNKQSDEVGDK